jgi:succinate dehydrogenase flavin-adding protein (antitoxin of CptAB toxin-antitoxin module)
MLNTTIESNPDILRKKLRWRSRRSLLELDLLLNKFVNSDVFDAFTVQKLETYQAMLKWDDDYLLSLLCNNIKHFDKDVTEIVELIMKE